MGRNYKLTQTGQEVQDILNRTYSFVTNAVDDLLYYYKKTETYNRDEITQLFASLTSGFLVPVPYLPEPSAATYGLKIYLVPASNPGVRDERIEYVTKYENGVYSWEKIGSTATNLDGYVTEDMLQDALEDYVSSEAFQQALAEKQDTLVSGENIKTVDGQSILGSGNLVSKSLSGSTAYWNAQTGFIPAEGQIIVYTDYKTTTVSGQTVNVPGVKVGTGNGYVQDLVFLGQADSDALLAHMADSDIHITASERQGWNNKLNVTDTQEVVGETLIFNRN